MIQVLGYYRDVDGEENNPADVYVAVAAVDGTELTFYSPVGQHSDGDEEYMEACEAISRTEYMEISKGFYTPEEYL